MINVSAFNQRSRSISKRLFRGSLNYRADFEIFDGGDSAGYNAEEVISRALGDQAELGNTFSVSHEEIIEEIRNGFVYLGDDGSHPNQNLVRSQEYQEEVRVIMAELSNWLNESEKVIGFWLKNGHPFYPVFWDYAFIVESGGTAHVFIGSSSD